MSKLDELIEKLCPNGVEYKKIGDISKVLRGKRLTTRDLVENGCYPIYHGGIIPIGYYDKNNRDANTTMIINVGASAGTIGYSDKEFWASDGCFCIEKNEILNDRYIYHYLLKYESFFKSKVRKAGIPTLDNKVIENFEIAVPPLEVQCEIVHILDDFTLLSAELSAELKARQKQYQYYRDNLLNFDEKTPRKTLAELCKLSAGGDIDKKNVVKEKNDDYDIPVYSNGIGTNALYGYTNSYKIEAPALTISGRGTIGYCELRKENFYPIVRLICLKPKDNNINISYLKYYIDTITFKVPTTGIPQLTVPMISNYLIPVPSLEEQERIVNILDRFDKLCNDISEGLPAEIEARQKQYEYYRDKLLTFERSPKVNE